MNQAKPASGMRDGFLLLQLVCCRLNPEVGVRFLLLMIILFMRMFMLMHSFVSSIVLSFSSLSESTFTLSNAALLFFIVCFFYGCPSLWSKSKDRRRIKAFPTFSCFRQIKCNKKVSPVHAQVLIYKNLHWFIKWDLSNIAII